MRLSPTAAEVACVMNLVRHAVRTGSARKLFGAYDIIGDKPPDAEVKAALQHALKRTADYNLDGDSDVGILYRRLYKRDYIEWFRIKDKDGSDTIPTPYAALPPVDREKIHMKLLHEKGLETDIMH